MNMNNNNNNMTTLLHNNENNENNNNLNNNGNNNGNNNNNNNKENNKRTLNEIFTPTSLAELPLDMLAHTLSFLTPQERLETARACKSLYKAASSLRPNPPDLEKPSLGVYKIDTPTDFATLMNKPNLIKQQWLAHCTLMIHDFESIATHPMHAPSYLGNFHLCLYANEQNSLFKPTNHGYIRRRMFSFLQKHLEAVHLKETILDREDMVITLSAIPKVFLYMCTINVSLTPLARPNARTQALFMDEECDTILETKVEVPALPILQVNLSRCSIVSPDDHPLQYSISNPKNHWTLDTPLPMSEEQRSLVSNAQGHVTLTTAFVWNNAFYVLPAQCKSLSWIGHPLNFPEDGHRMRVCPLRSKSNPIVHLKTKHIIFSLPRRILLDLDLADVTPESPNAPIQYPLPTGPSSNPLSQFLPCLETLCIEDGWLPESVSTYGLRHLFPALRVLEIYLVLMPWHSFTTPPNMVTTRAERAPEDLQIHEMVHVIDDDSNDDHSDDDHSDDDHSDDDDSDIDQHRINERVRHQRFEDSISDPQPAGLLSIRGMPFLHTVRLLIHNAGTHFVLSDNPNLSTLQVLQDTPTTLDVSTHPNLHKVTVWTQDYMPPNQHRFTMDISEGEPHPISMDMQPLCYSDFQSRLSCEESPIFHQLKLKTF